MRRHDLDLTSLVSGAIFVAVGLLFVLDRTADSSPSPRWVTPLVLIGVGLAGLLSTVKSGHREPVASPLEDELLTADPDPDPRP